MSGNYRYLGWLLLLWGMLLCGAVEAAGVKTYNKVGLEMQWRWKQEKLGFGGGMAREGWDVTRADFLDIRFGAAAGGRQLVGNRWLAGLF